MDREEFILEVSKLGIGVTDEQLEKLDRYYELLVNWNEKFNLTAITEKKQVYLKHFYDSLTLIKVINLNNEKTLCDIGSGAGFPGIVIKIFYPNLKVTLIDSLNKRIVFLSEVIKDLKLDNIEAIHARAEKYALENRDKFDVVTARAVSSMNILLEISIPLLKTNKYFIAMRGQEENGYSKALETLGCEVVMKKSFLLPFENSQRTIIKIVKNKETAMKYPRKFSVIKKKPI